MVRILPEGSNYREFSTPGVIVMEEQPPTIIGERAVRVLQLISDFTWGPELEATAVVDFNDAIRLFGGYKEGLKGYLDLLAIYSQGPLNVEIIRIVPPEGTPVKASYTVTNSHWYQIDSNNIVRFMCKEPTYGRPTNVEITDGSGANKNITIKGPLYLDDSNNIVRFIYNGSGIGTGTTITIEDGTNPDTKKITINEGQADEEVYDNLDMNELNNSTYLVNVISNQSSLVRVERLSGMNNDDLPANQTSTPMTQTVTETYTDLDMDETGGSYIVDTINSNSDLVVVDRLSALSDDTLPANQSPNGMTDVENIDIIQFEHKVAGLDGNYVRVSISDGTPGTKTVNITDLKNNQTETFSNLVMDSLASNYLVDVITNQSSIVNVTRVDVNSNNLLPRNLDTEALQNGSNGGLTYASLIAKDGVGNDNIKFIAKYRGSHGNNITIKIVNYTTYVDVYITDNYGQVERFRKLDMNSTSSKYLVDYINNNSDYVTVERLSPITDTTLPASLLTYTNLEGGSDGDPVNDASIQAGITKSGEYDYADIVTYGSHSNGQSNANAIALKTLVENLRERNAILNSDSGATENEAIAFSEEMSSPFVIVTHPEQTIYNPATNQIHTIASSPFYAGRLATLSFESSPSYQKINGSLGPTRNIVMTGFNAISDKLTDGGVSPIGEIKGLGIAIMNGINSSRDETVEQISTVSMRSFIARNLALGLVPLVSKLHTPNLREKCKSSVVSYLTRLFDEGRIGDPDSGDPRDAFSVDVSSNVNTKPVVQSKTLIIYVKVLLLAAADHILVKLNAGETVTFDY